MENVITTSRVETLVTECVDAHTGETYIKTERIGRASYVYNGKEIVADEYVTLDYGKQGVTHSFGCHPEGMPAGEFWNVEQPHIQKLCAAGGRIHRSHMAARMK